MTATATAGVVDERDVQALIWQRRARDWVYDQSTSKRANRAVALVVADALGWAGDAVVGMATIAQRAGVATSTAETAVAALVAAGELTVVETGGRGTGGRGRANRYRFTHVRFDGTVHNPPTTGDETIPMSPTVGPDDTHMSPGTGGLWAPNTPVPGEFEPVKSPVVGEPTGSGITISLNPGRVTREGSLPAPTDLREASLVSRLVAVCDQGRWSPGALRDTARRVVTMLCAHLDHRLVDEIIGVCETLPAPPAGPVYVLEIANRRSAAEGWGLPTLRLAAAS